MKVLADAKSRPGEPKRCPVTSQLMSGPIIDKFFIIGAIAGCVGGALLGATMWAMLHGVIPVSADYARMRELHVVIGFYLFFGLFICGFLLHMGPRILQSSRGFGPLYLLVALVVVAGCGVMVAIPDSVIGRGLLSLPFLFLLGVFLRELKNAPPDARQMFGPWLITSLLTFVAAAWLPLVNPLTALSVIWLAVASITLAAGRAFIIGALEGRRMSSSENAILFLLFAGCTVCLLRGYLQIAGLFAIICFAAYAWTTRCLSSYRALLAGKANVPILTVSFLFAYSWAILGAISLALGGDRAADGVLHIWALGWISTLVIGISSQMMRALTGAMPLPEKWIIALVAMWQVTPLVRGFGRELGAGSGSAVVLATVTWVVLLSWSGAFIIAAKRLWLKRQSKLQTYVHSG